MNNVNLLFTMKNIVSAVREESSQLVEILEINNEFSDALRIKHLLVPTVIENGTQSTAILDCDYIYDQPPLGLVVKWFFNNQPNPVYQWIPNKRPQDLGVLKGKLNLDYKASDEASKMHRALQIVNPTTDLSGEYRCVVSTFDDEATEAKKMIIFEQSVTPYYYTRERNKIRDKIFASLNGNRKNVTFIGSLFALKIRMKGVIVGWGTRFP
uniref:Ig domain-containing protein n=1 Tax=Rhodnius prolixus TaxID=13249 RepID=T1H7W0_RHOPR